MNFYGTNLPGGIISTVSAWESQIPAQKRQEDGLLISSSIQGQECSDEKCQLAEVLEVNLSEMEKQGTLSCLDLVSLSLTPPCKGGPGTEG